MTDDQDPRLSPPTTKTGRLQRALLALLAKHERDGGIPTNGRFLWYELVQARTVDKDKARGHPGVKRGIDQDVNTALTILRERGIIPWTWIVDETRSTYLYTGARSLLARLRAQLEHVRLDPRWLVWRDCAQKVPAGGEVLVAGALRVICPEHRNEVRRVRDAGLLDKLRWTSAPTRPRRPPRVPPGQLQLVEVPPVRKGVP